MTLSKLNRSPKPQRLSFIQRLKLSLWFERGMALIAAVNLGLVFFDITYIPLRDFWLQGRVQLFFKAGPIEYKFPEEPLKILAFPVTQYYDWVKGIEPYIDTAQYLNRVDDFDAKRDEILKPSEEELFKPSEIINPSETLINSQPKQSETLSSEEELSEENLSEEQFIEEELKPR